MDTPTAKDRFQKHAARVEASLERIKQGLVEFYAEFETDGRSADWGYVGSLEGIADDLNDLADRLHGTGEYKETE